MKKTITLIFLILCIGITFGQNCKFKINETNEFTGVSKMETKRVWFHGDMSGGHGIIFTKIDTVYFLKCYKSIIGTTSLFVSIGDKLYLKLESDKMITLENKTPTKTKFISGGSTNVSYVIPHYSISKEELILLSKYKITSFRFETADYYKEAEANKKRGLDKIKNNANCILKK